MVKVTSSNFKTQSLFVRQTLVLVTVQTKNTMTLCKKQKFFRPEFLNRFNGIVEFLHLDKESLQEIINLLLDDVQVTLDKKGYDECLKMQKIG